MTASAGLRGRRHTTDTASGAGGGPAAPGSGRRAVALLTVTGAAQLAANATAALVATMVLGPAQRGLMVIGMTLGGVVAMLACLGTSAALRARLPVTDDPRARWRLLSAYSWWTLAAAVLAASGTVALSWLSAAVIDPALADGGFLLAVAVFAIGQVLLLQVVEAWFADGRFAMAGTAAALVAACGLLGLLSALAATAAGAALASTTVTTAGDTSTTAATATADAAAVTDGATGGASGVATATVLLGAQGMGVLVACLLQLRSLHAAGLLSTARPRRRDLGSLLAGGVPTLGLVLGLAVALRADRYVLGAAGGVAAVGVYSLAATLSEVCRMAPVAIGQLFQRGSAVRAARGVRGLRADRGVRGAADRGAWAGRAGGGVSRRGGRTVRTEGAVRGGGPGLVGAVVVATAAAAVGGVVVAVVGWFAIGPVFGPEFAGARGLLVVLVVAEVCFAPYAVASRGLLGGGWTRAAGVFGLVGGAVAVLAYLVGSRVGGATGLAIACVAVYAWLSVTSSVIFHRKAGS